MRITEFFRQLKARGRTFLSQRDNLALLMVVGGAFLVIAVVVLAFFYKPSKDVADVIVPPAEETVIRHPLTGERLETALAELPKVLGIMIENSADAWPLSGLEGAFMVIEAPAEGNIPRFLAFFEAAAEVKKIGPVRSARPYYVDWASQFDTLVYGHVGGSPEALQLLASGERAIIDLNEFWQGEYFYRDHSRYAPHNAYTSSELLREALTELTPDVPNYTSPAFKDDQPVEGAGTSAVLDWGPGSTYDVTWQYSSATNSYFRLQAGEAMLVNQHHPGFGDDVRADNVMVIATDIVSIDNVDRKRITTIGQGDALLFQDGKVLLGRWQKTAPEEPLRMLDEAGNELPFNAGVTWVEVVRSVSAVSLETAD